VSFVSIVVEVPEATALVLDAGVTTARAPVLARRVTASEAETPVLLDGYDKLARGSCSISTESNDDRWIGGVWTPSLGSYRMTEGRGVATKLEMEARVVVIPGV
jgi:hypothetical protein